MRAVQTNVTLALLLRIVEGMRVKKRPDELAADIFQPEFEMCVLVDGVMAAVEGSGADVDALLVGDFFRADQARGVAGACGSDGGVEGMGEGIAQRDARRRRLHQFAGARGFEHAGLRGHDGRLFYTGGEKEHRLVNGDSVNGRWIVRLCAANEPTRGRLINGRRGREEFPQGLKPDFARL